MRQLALDLARLYVAARERAYTLELASKEQQAMNTADDYMAAKPGRVILTISGVAIAISDQAAAQLVAYGSAYRCDGCHCYHLTPAYDMIVGTGQAILDVSELTGEHKADDPRAVMADSMLAKITGHRKSVAAEPMKPAPAFLSGAVEDRRSLDLLRQRTRTTRSEVEAVTDAIRKADWFTLNREAVIIRLPHMVYQRQTDTAGEGWTEEPWDWKVTPEGHVLRGPFLDDPAPLFNLKRASEIDGIVPLKLLRDPLAKIIVGAHRFFSAYYLSGPELSQ